ncbi:MAG: signal peptidase I [Acidobacteriota bacterium]
MRLTATRRTEMRRARTTRAARSKDRAPVGTIIVAVVVCALVAAFLAMPLFGLKMYVITGGSMNGTISRGALIFAKTVPVSTLEVGDIITYRPPDRSAYVTHRLISIDHQTDGKAVFRTKGDFNETEDPWLFTLDRPLQAKYVTQVPYLGYALAFLGLPIARAFLFAVPALIVVLVLFLTLWRRSGETRWLRGPRGPVSEAKHAACPQDYTRVSGRRVNRRR